MEQSELQSEMHNLFDIVIGYGYQADSVCNLSLEELRKIVKEKEKE